MTYPADPRALPGRESYSGVRVLCLRKTTEGAYEVTAFAPISYLRDQTASSLQEDHMKEPALQQRPVLQSLPLMLTALHRCCLTVAVALVPQILSGGACGKIMVWRLSAPGGNKRGVAIGEPAAHCLDETNEDPLKADRIVGMDAYPVMDKERFPELKQVSVSGEAASATSSAAALLLYAFYHCRS